MDLFPSTGMQSSLDEHSPSQWHLRLPFMFRFLESASPHADGQQTAGESTPHQTGLDNKFVDDTMEDEDEDDDPRADRTGLVADSDTKEDEDY